MQNTEYKAGHYTFYVCQSSEGTDIVVRLNGRRIREVEYRELYRAFTCKFGQEMTPSLLKALIETFVTAKNTGAESEARLNFHRACWWVNSRLFVYRATRNPKWANPFGV